MFRLALACGSGFGGQICEQGKGFFEINRQFLRRKAAVHKLLSLYCGKAAMNRWFSFAFGEIQSEILINCRCEASPFIKLKTSKTYD